MNARQRAKFEERFGPKPGKLADEVNYLVHECTYSAACQDEAEAVRGLVEALEPDRLAIAFHEAYERLAPQFGYTTRKDTRQFVPESANGKLMLAVCAEVAAAALKAWKGE